MSKENQNIIILGCQRAGKTTLSRILAQKSNYSIMSIDSLIYAFSQNMPQLNINTNTKISEKTEVLAPFVASYFESFMRDYPNQKFILECCQLLPISVMKQKVLNRCKIICLGYPNASVDEIYDNIRKNDPNIRSSYTKNLTDEDLKKRIQSWIKYSQILQTQSNKLKIPFYETNINRNQILKEIADKLENDSLDIGVR